MEKKKTKSRFYTCLNWMFVIIFALLAWFAYSHYKNRAGDVSIKQQYQFADVNSVHLSAARAKGIKPIDNVNQLNTKGLVKIKTCNCYKLDRLKYSVPYLIPTSQALLNEIGTRFQTALKTQGMEKHRIIVTSVLRTEENVKKLMEVNGNASKNSAHQYATTFDIAYTRFDHQSWSGKNASNQELANILGQVLEQLRKEGRCYVKYEYLQHCYHITAR